MNESMKGYEDVGFEKSGIYGLISISTESAS